MNTQVDTPDWSKIPAPTDDGAARHLTGMRIPSVSLPATDGTTVDLSVLTGLVVVYAYPRTGRPGVENPDGWDLIPGARGCTQQSCSFADHFGELKSLGVIMCSAYPRKTAGIKPRPRRLNAVSDPLGRASHAGERDAPADVRNEWPDPAQTTDAGDRRWTDRTCLLSGLSARSERGRGPEVASSSVGGNPKVGRKPGPRSRPDCARRDSRKTPCGCRRPLWRRFRGQPQSPGALHEGGRRPPEGRMSPPKPTGPINSCATARNWAAKRRAGVR